MHISNLHLRNGLRIGDHSRIMTANSFTDDIFNTSQQRSLCFWIYGLEQTVPTSIIMHLRGSTTYLELYRFREGVLTLNISNPTHQTVARIRSISPGIETNKLNYFALNKPADLNASTWSFTVRKGNTFQNETTDVISNLPSGHTFPATFCTLANRGARDIACTGVYGRFTVFNKVLSAAEHTLMYKYRGGIPKQLQGNIFYDLVFNNSEGQRTLTPAIGTSTFLLDNTSWTDTELQTSWTDMY